MHPPSNPGRALTTAEPFPVLRERDFLRIAHIAHRCFGLDLRDGKEGLVASRLGRLVRELGLASFQDYCDYLHADRTGAALATLADRLTTNHTSFFREPAHFDLLCNTVFPALRTRPRIEIWSAGCSSGEEPYSIAISLLEAVPHLAPRVRIHATDISTRMLHRASDAIYTAERIAHVPPEFRERHFVPTDQPSTFRITPHTRALVDVSRFNLMDPVPPAARYSVIFCRNVMFYFDRAAHRDLVERLSSHLEPGGFLFIGHSESLNGISHSLEPVAPSVFRKPLHARSLSRSTSRRDVGSVKAPPPAAPAQHSPVAQEEVSA